MIALPLNVVNLLHIGVTIPLFIYLAMYRSESNPMILRALPLIALGGTIISWNAPQYCSLRWIRLWLSSVGKCGSYDDYLSTAILDQ
jgi:hypothetical protein